MAKRKSNDYFDDFFPHSRPIRTKDGIQSRSQKGAFASAWWAKRWLDVLESYGIGSRLQRGRSYARNGQVLNIDIQPGLIIARVQGSRPTPYKVNIQIDPLNDAAWEQAFDVISGEALFTAQLLEGTMPQDIETAFEAAGIPLFPEQLSDLHTACSCPDYANPCKHIAAVYYLIGEQFDLDPFLLLTLRGRSRDQVMDALRVRRAKAVGASLASVVHQENNPPKLDEQLEQFWGKATLDWTTLPFTFPSELHIPSTALIHRLMNSKRRSPNFMSS